MTALPQPQMEAPKPSRRSQPFAARRAWKRRAQRVRVNRRGTISKQWLATHPDPLARQQLGKAGRLGIGGLLIIGSLVLHGGTMIGFALVGELISHQDGARVFQNERLEVAVVEKVPPKAPEPEPTPKQEQKKAPKVMKRFCLRAMKMFSVEGT